jgi:hypothetical protein
VLGAGYPFPGFVPHAAAEAGSHHVRRKTPGSVALLGVQLLTAWAYPKREYPSRMRQACGNVEDIGVALPG